ncbi:hypothetical protein LOTGIDRAFT_229418 [Lottia gigantea]|uniref:Uncharacterized protein n=1 Tax=Lottia gigantea TaxID=225164 RepID=V3ZS98_LOTGI|nr:hypothetical protein LOTGIDRAFT_229418 [Lottia gigantea]ESO85395.1 hypothetical protein LOTGIDRAFT_229418 [Lottia gigantea]
MTSLSVQWRRMGNEHFKNIPKELSPILVKERLIKANNCYYKADSYAGNPEEKASAKKNLAVTAGRIAEIFRRLKEKNSQIKFYYKECLSQFKEAMTIGSDNTEDWLIDIETKSLNVWLNLQEFLLDENMEDRIKSYETFIPFIIGSEIKSSAYKDLARCIFHLAISKLVDKDYKASLSLLKGAYSPLTEASTNTIRSKIAEEEIENLREDIFVQTCIAESMQALNIADAMLDSTIYNEEDVNFDKIWVIIDDYRNVINLTRGRDIEMEAIANSRIGNIYYPKDGH